ncbi:DUF7455 domain-containing protein [Streptomyces sp. NPDC055085]
MVEPCDRCGPYVKAVHRFTKPDACMLYLCGHHFDQLSPALFGGGWSVTAYPEDLEES